METDQSPSNGEGTHHARDALRDVGHARDNLASRLRAPWWYRIGVALCTLALFVGMGLYVGNENTSDTLANTVIVLGAVVAPAVLLALLKNATGVSIDRYSKGLGSWCVLVFGLLIIAFPLQAWAGVRYALPVAGVIAGVATYFRERRIDTLVQDRVRGGTQEA